ncbi:hypothetical protein [Jiangella endophytica]|uniref:hypothetical protein n=1 Tax=Jiangella endophytica TaxID=1623398 RepID=UPI000E34E1DB|nr:hypothetical protein [Jiangella endophytica]
MTAPSMRGVSYAVSHPPAVVRRVMTTIRDDLHATAVMVLDTDPRALVAACRIALEEGLDVLVRPSLENARLPELTRHLRQVAEGAEQLRRQHPGQVTLLLGSEFSLTSRTVLPGRHTFVRLQLLLRSGPLLRRRIRTRLAPVLAALLATARAEFRGPVTYAAGAWEQLDWSGFDVVGVNLYRSGRNTARYADLLHTRVSAARAAGKPFIVTEFGCGAFTGADVQGPGSFRIVNWFTDPPAIRGDHPRDEHTQAAYLSGLIELYGAAGVDGCFAFTFVMPEFPRGDDPRHDLDRAGFGLVSVRPGEPDAWAPKEAFHAVARAFDPSAGR